MMPCFLAAVLIIIGLVIAGLAIHLTNLFNAKDQSIKDMGTELQELNDQVVKLGNEHLHTLGLLGDTKEQLEKTQSELKDLIERKRQTGPTMAGLEDAMAALIGVKMNRDVEQVRLDAALNCLQILRQGPHAYNPEKPSGERESFK